MLEMGEEKLYELMKKTGRNHYSPEKARELLEMAKDKHYLQTIPGISDLMAAMIWAELVQPYCPR